MHFSILTGLALTAASLVAGKEVPKDESRAEMYDSGMVHMENMERKKALWMADFEAGLMNSSKWPRLNYTQCIDGKAEAVKGDPLQTFRCKNVDLYDFINHATLGSPRGWDEKKNGELLTGSSSWGWTDPESKREFVASGMYQGTAFIEVLPEGRLLPLGFLPCPAPTNANAFWKEIRSFKNYMLIGSELNNHGIQIFDMRKLLDINPTKAPVTFDIKKDVTGHFKDLPLGAAHNVVINEENEYAVAVGSRPRNDSCAAGLIFIDMKDPSKPVRMGCNGQDGYVHDAQCLPYRGPDKKYLGRDICYGYNEDTLTIYDVTDKANSSIISITSYEGATYTHQGWVLDPAWQEWLIMDDEFDEINSTGPAADGYPVTYIWNISSLEHPKQTGLYKGTVRSSDHNQYIKDGLTYQSSYSSGLRVYDISSIPEDPTGGSTCEVAYFDIYPEDDSLPGGGKPDLRGTWSSYARFESGFIYVNTIERGGYLVKMTKRESCPKKTCGVDNCLRTMQASTVPGRLEESQNFCSNFTIGFKAKVNAVPKYASEACGQNVISSVSSACSCLPTATSTPVAATLTQ